MRNFFFCSRVPTKFSRTFLRTRVAFSNPPFFTQLSTFSPSRRFPLLLRFPLPGKLHQNKRAVLPQTFSEQSCSGAAAGGSWQQQRAAAVLHQKRSFLTAAVPPIPGKCTSCGGPEPVRKHSSQKTSMVVVVVMVVRPYQSRSRSFPLSLSLIHPPTQTHSHSPSLSFPPFLSR